jgi:hypothetical protein
MRSAVTSVTVDLQPGSKVKLNGPGVASDRLGEPGHVLRTQRRLDRAYIIQHLSGAMVDYQNGHMSGADNNIERLTGRRPMTVGAFARAHADILNAISS